MNIEEIIKKLPPELQEKARACKSTEELLALRNEHAVNLTPEELAAVAGGTGGSPQNCGKTKCPKCGSTNVTVTNETLPSGWVRVHRKCHDCGYKWYTDYPPID